MRQAYVFEEHAAVLAHWASRGLRGATVVILDAHLDLQPISAAAIEQLRQCVDAEQLRACGCELPFADGGRGLYGIEDFLHPAAALGLVRTVVWVLPPHVQRAGLAGGLARLAQMPSVSIEALESFEPRPGGWLSGHLLGLDVWVCLPEHLAGLPLPAQWELDVDLDFFVDLPSGEVLLDPVALLRSLRSLPGSPQVLTISRSAISGFTPMALRRMAEPLADLWRGEACSWVAPDSMPQEVGPDVRLAIAGARSRGEAVVPEQLSAWASKLDSLPSTGDDMTIAAWVHLGLLACAAGRADVARKAWRWLETHGRQHPELALELAHMLAGIARLQEASDYLALAMETESTRWRAGMLACRLLLRSGDAVLALREARAGVAACPANPGARDLLAESCRLVADVEGAREAQAAAMDLRRRLSRVARRLVVTAPP